MSRVSSLPWLLVALALAGVARPLSAATPPSDRTATAFIFHPLTLQKLEDMEFGGLAVTTAGTAVLDPITNTLSTTGGVTAIAGTPHGAKFRGSADGGPVVNIKVPKQPVTLTRSGGTETITLSDFTLDGPAKRTMGQATSFDFRVGGTLTIAANQAEGDYVGTLSVTAQYP
jgi:hypothetical protein